jgi:hypothetical protein
VVVHIAPWQTGHKDVRYKLVGKGAEPVVGLMGDSKTELDILVIHNVVLIKESYFIEDVFPVKGSGAGDEID